MQRAQRLSEIVEIVRDGRLHLARDIAEVLEVSERSIYRDIATLIASGVPIDGERGVGYLLREPVFIPPMTLSITELEALNLGMSIVQQVADKELQAAAKTLHEKIASHAPNRRQSPKSWGIGLYEFKRLRDGLRHMPKIRRAIRESRKIIIEYSSLSGRGNVRKIRPLQTEYWGKAWTVSAWCELREDFRVFRIDRIENCTMTDEIFLAEPGKTVEDFLIHVAK